MTTKDPTAKSHTISVLVENQFGVLARISGLFSARGYNIDSLCVGVTDDPSISRMTVVVKGDDHVLDQIVNQLNKLPEVIEVIDLTKQDFVDRELMMIKVSAEGPTRSGLLEVVEIFRAKVCDVSPSTLTVEATGSDGKLQAFIDMVRPFGIVELARTGKIAMARAPRTTREKTQS